MGRDLGFWPLNPSSTNLLIGPRVVVQTGPNEGWALVRPAPRSVSHSVPLLYLSVMVEAGLSEERSGLERRNEEEETVKKATWALAGW